MEITSEVQRVRPSPTLNTVIMVEDVLKNARGSPMAVAEIRKSLPRQVNHYALMSVLEYLERTGSIKVTLGGIIWIRTPLQQ